MDPKAFAESILQRQRFAAHMGTRLLVFTEGRAELALDITDDHRQQHGFVHGGVLAYLADNALTFAGGSVLGDSLTVEFKINYVRPAKGKGRLRAVGEVVGHGKSQAVVRCDIFMEPEGGEPELCAAAQGTIRKVR